MIFVWIVWVILVDFVGIGFISEVIWEGYFLYFVLVNDVNCDGFVVWGLFVCWLVLDVGANFMFWLVVVFFW